MHGWLTTRDHVYLPKVIPINFSQPSLSSWGLSGHWQLGCRCLGFLSQTPLEQKAATFVYPSNTSAQIPPSHSCILQTLPLQHASLPTSTGLPLLSSHPTSAALEAAAQRPASGAGPELATGPDPRTRCRQTSCRGGGGPRTQHRRLGSRHAGTRWQRVHSSPGRLRQWVHHHSFASGC